MSRREERLLAAAGGVLGAVAVAPVLLYVAYRIEQRQVHKRAVKR